MSKKPCAIALGFFDGVHIAHRKIITNTVNYAKENNLCPIVLSFDASPLEILAPDKIRYLTTKEEKAQLISSLGAAAEFLPLSSRLLSMEPEDFIEKILVDRYNIKYACCGYNYRFGKSGRGDTRMLSAAGNCYGFKTEVCDNEIVRGESVSSSRIRDLIANGNICEANELLGRSFSVTGIVCEGKHLGRRLGFPTANVFLDDMTVIPKKGVYKTTVTVDGESCSAITNTGINPTVGGEKLRTETYIPGFEGNLYGKEIKIEFLDFIRTEKRFDSVKELVLQIEKDLERLQ